MGEEKKAEETKPEAKEEAKKPENQGEDKKEEKKPEEESKDNTPPPPQPPPEIVLKVFMHCEGCARKVRRCLKGFPGVEEVIIDCKSHKVVVRGEEADPQRVLERVQKKSHRQVELISPIPKPPTEEEKKPEEKDKPAPEEKKEEAQIITVILKVHMHCEACAQEIKRRILKMMGVESAEADLNKSEVSVKGVFDPAKLVEFVLKRTGKQAVILKQEAVEKKADEGGAGEKEKKEEEGKGEEKEGEKNGEGEAAAVAAKVEEEAVTEETKVVEMKSEYQYYPPRYVMEMYAYPPQIFSDENPNACSVM